MFINIVKFTLRKWLSLIILWMIFTFFTIGKSWGQGTLPPNFNDVLVIGGWTDVEGFQFDSLNRMFVWEKEGKVWVVDTNNVKLSTPLIDISEEVGDWRDHGLNSVVLDPNFNTNGYFYLMYDVDRHYLLNYGTPQYSSTNNEYFDATIERVTRFTADPATNFTTVINGSRLVLIGETKKTGIPITHESHSGGSLVFGSDGSLLISTGDGASFNTVDAGSSGDTYWSQGLADSIIRPKENVGAFRAQLVDCLNGKILRINPANGDGLPTNPFYDAANPRAAKSRVWSLGLRNPFRMSLRPGTGSSDITAGDPGVLFVGDVQWSIWEDLNVATTPGQNFGWPIFEGLTLQGQGYVTAAAQNMDAPNPLYGTGGCTQQYFLFNQLINQDTIGTPLWKNPCDSSQTIPAGIPKFIHSRPAVDYYHGIESRTGIYNGTSASTVDLNDPSSPVQGPQFGGNGILGGIWYTGNAYPVQYRNRYYCADYGGSWIKTFGFNNQNKPIDVADFGTNMGAAVFTGINPKTKEIYYARYSDQIKKITYSLNVNNPPIAVASQNIIYGSSPLQVIFTGSASSDPEGQPLIYAWNFGDGGSSNHADTSHTFIATAGVSTTFTVTLTVTDNIGQTSVATMHVYVNNTPPQVTITSFNNGDLFSPTNPTTLPLQANVTDLEQGPNQLFYSWITSLHHNNHYHPEPPDTNRITSTHLSPVNCDDSLNVFSYDIKLTVTDAGGLSTTVLQTVYPACDPPVAQFTANHISICGSGTVSFTNQSLNLPDSYSWSFPGGNPSSSTIANPMVTYSSVGHHTVSLTVTSTRGTNTLQKTGYIRVHPLPIIVNAGSYAPLCSNSGLIHLTGIPIGGTYSGNGISNNTFDPSVGQGTYPITYSYTNANGCTKSSSTNIIVNSIPVVSAGTYSPVCVNGSVVALNGSPTGGAFTGPGVTGNSFDPSIGQGNYIVKYSYTDGNGCNNSDTALIIVNNCNCATPLQPSGISTMGGTSKVCPGDSKSYSVILKPNVTYNWVVPNGAVINSGQGSNIIHVSFNSLFTQSTAVITVTANNTCGASPARTLSISRNNPLTPVSINGPLNGVCNLTNVSYSTPNVSGNTFNWHFSSTKGTITGGQTTPSIITSFTNGFASVNLSVTSNNGCGTSSPRTIIIKPTPVTPSAITGNASPCINQSSVPYSVNPVSNATKYLWSAPAGSNISDGVSSAFSSLTSSSNAVSVSFGATAGKIICNAGNVCGYGSQSALNINFGCRDAESNMEKKNKVDGSIQVYPNPTNGKIEVEYISDVSKNITITIMDILGQTRVIKNIICKEGINKTIFDLSDYSKGVYLLEWNDNQVHHYAKVALN